MIINLRARIRFRLYQLLHLRSTKVDETSEEVMDFEQPPVVAAAVDGQIFHQ
jgi:hypothetical protein